MLTGVQGISVYAESMKHDALETVLLKLSPVDALTALDFCEGTLITGSPGSGKSSTAGKEIAHSFLKAGMGGLVLTAKGEEVETWKRYAKECGREDDLIIFSLDSGHQMDPLFYTWNRPGRGAEDLESLIETFTALMAIGEKER